VRLGEGELVGGAWALASALGECAEQDEVDGVPKQAAVDLGHWVQPVREGRRPRRTLVDAIMGYRGRWR
jgi:hypothetical protein